MNLNDMLVLEQKVRDLVVSRVKNDIETELPSFRGHVDIDWGKLRVTRRQDNEFMITGSALLPAHKIFFEYNIVANSLDDIDIKFDIVNSIIL